MCADGVRLFQLYGSSSPPATLLNTVEPVCGSDIHAHTRAWVAAIGADANPSGQFAEYHSKSCFHVRYWSRPSIVTAANGLPDSAVTSASAQYPMKKL